MSPPCQLVMNSLIPCSINMHAVHHLVTVFQEAEQLAQQLWGLWTDYRDTEP